MNPNFKINIKLHQRLRLHFLELTHGRNSFSIVASKSNINERQTKRDRGDLVARNALNTDHPTASIWLMTGDRGIRVTRLQGSFVKGFRKNRWAIDPLLCLSSRLNQKRTSIPLPCFFPLFPLRCVLTDVRKQFTNNVIRNLFAYCWHLLKHDLFQYFCNAKNKYLPFVLKYKELSRINKQIKYLQPITGDYSLS